MLSCWGSTLTLAAAAEEDAAAEENADADGADDAGTFAFTFAPIQHATNRT